VIGIGGDPFARARAAGVEDFDRVTDDASGDTGARATAGPTGRGAAVTPLAATILGLDGPVNSVDVGSASR
jgi:hypothetical protein